MNNDSRVLLGLLALLGIVMIILGIVSMVLPPALTGVGFLILAYLIYKILEGRAPQSIRAPVGGRR
ncbi:MAG: hypothetical protein ACLFR7_03875 [Opitutales bacterium]